MNLDIAKIMQKKYFRKMAHFCWMTALVIQQKKSSDEANTIRCTTHDTNLQNKQDGTFNEYTTDSTNLFDDCTISFKLKFEPIRDVSRYDNIIENRSNLLTLIMFLVIGILAVPVILPHLLHKFQVFHILIHLSGISLAVFLSVISAIAYSRVKTKRMFFTMIAFSLFVIAEALSLVDAAWQYTYYLGPFPAEEIGHFFELSTLGMFAISVFRKD
ncbi:MAG: hypothetical protein KGH95_00135 [Thaumarchaeota archaeon]|nr:hypothetical protein [Nitrososphaerota archaeon]